jgi:predicted PurR-regulated permease PerM
MNRLFFIIVLLFILIIPQAWGQTTQYPNINRQTTWNNLTDSVHTIGQTPQQARVTKWKLHQLRTKNRLNSINQARRQAWLNS